MDDNKDQSIDSKDLPVSKAVRETDPSQYPPPADSDEPIKNAEKADPSLQGNATERTSSEAGLNEEQSHGDAGAFEGLEDQQK